MTRASIRLTGTALLATLVIVLDYALKFSGFKIPFPWMPTLKFDFTGIPIVLSLLMFGPASALTTSLVALVAILARSGDLIGATSKFAAEFSTAIGLFLGLKIGGKLSKRYQFFSGTLSSILFRVVIMSVVNLLLLPFYGMPASTVYVMLPLIAAFNVAQGAITVLLGAFLHGLVEKRLPTASKKNG